MRSDIDRKMLIAYLDQRCEYLDKKGIEAPMGSKAELYWMSAWTEAVQIRNAILTSNYNDPLGATHDKIAPPTRKAT